MMNKMKNSLWKNSLLLAVLFFLTASCVEQQKPEKKVTKYYDIKGLLNDQVDYIASRSHELQKSIWLDGTNESKALTLSDEEWEKELEAFYELDLNKAVLSDAYQIQKDSSDSGRQITYRAFNPEKVQVEYLRLWFDRKDLLTRLEARYHEDNHLFRSKKKVMAHFEPADTQIRLKEYVVEGMQKLVLKDSVTYRMEAAVAYE